MGSQRTYPFIPGSDVQWGLHSWVQQDGSEQKTSSEWVSSQGSAQRKQTETPISLSSPERDIFAYFKSCNLRFHLPISLKPRVDWDSPNQGTDRSWSTLNYWELLKVKEPAWQSQRSEREPRAQTGLNSKIHFLHNTTTSKLGEVVVLPNARNQHRESRKMKKQRNIFQMRE